MDKQLRSRKIVVTPEKELTNGQNGHSHQNGHTIQNGQNGHHIKATNGTTKLSAGEMSRSIGDAFLQSWINTTLLPFCMLFFAPTLGIALWYTTEKCDGSFMKMLHVFENGNILGGILKMWEGSAIKGPLIPSIFFGYLSYCVVTMIAMPGKRFEGPVTVNGNTPVYKDNGFYCYLLSLIILAVLTVVLKSYGASPTVIYDRFNEVLLFLNTFSLLFCLVLYFKGRFAPSNSDSGASGNFILDYYWGTELYPRIFGVDVKVLINCRYGMTGWALLVIIFSLKSYELHGFVDSVFISAVLQIVYITKFFWWESGYMKTLDIILDRAGFYICWGCLVFIPSLYTYVSMFLVKHPVHLGPAVSLFILALGLSSIYINYDTDWQKLLVRQSNGKCTLWGKQPDVIHAKYRQADGEEKKSILLISGWWGVSRHFNYFLELILAFAWTMPAMFTHLAPYAYFIFLVILLVHRSFRDDAKCKEKYGAYWREYCTRVPNRIIPCIF